MPALAELEAGVDRGARRPGFQAELRRAAARLRRAPVAALPARRLSEARRPRRLPQARGPQPHRRAQDQQRARPGPARQAHGQDADHRRDRRRPARRRDRDRVRAARARVRRLHGHRGHAPPEAQRERMELLGARVAPVDAGARTLKEATSARRSATGSRTSATTHYVHRLVRRPGAVPGARARPAARDRRRGARAAARAAAGRLPDRVIACVGGGSNAIGIFTRVRRRRGASRWSASRPAGEGIDTRAPRRAADRRRPRRRPARLLLGDHAGRGRPDPRGALDLGRARLSRAPAPSTRGCATAAAPATSRSPTRRRSRPSTLHPAGGHHPRAGVRRTRSPGCSTSRAPAGTRPRLPVRPRRQGPGRGAGQARRRRAHERRCRVSERPGRDGVAAALIAAAFASARGGRR